MINGRIVATVTGLCMAAAVAANDVKVEAEQSTYSNCQVSQGSSYSGGKALKFIAENAKADFKVDLPESGKYKLRVAGNGIGGEKKVNCKVNNSSNSFSLNSYGEVTVGTFNLDKGENHIVITPDWTWFEVDYILLDDGENGSVEFNLSPNPVDNDATATASSLYTFLADNFGKKSISGMMTGDMSSANGNILQHDDIRAVYNVAGKYPALVGFDFMNATGKNAGQGWYKGYTRDCIELAKDTWRRGGIPAFTWHWRDPSRSTDEFYTSGTDMKISRAMNSDGSWNVSSSLYRNIVADIHDVADYLLELQREDMACIFRPLHEADGGWFWWGREGGTNCAKLYRLLYHEIVEVKGVHNVIWVLNADISDPSWNPGNDYFDVISTDIYNSDFDYSSCSAAFESLRRLTGGKKIIALSENGPVPDIQREVDDEAVWSWWMPWYQTWNGNFVDKTSPEQWRKVMSDPRVITLEDMPKLSGIETVESTEPTSCENDAYYNVYGQRVSPSAGPGIYIHNGKKIIVGSEGLR